ncbi:MAG: hemolysin, partial [Roseateles sp.]
MKAQFLSASLLAAGVLLAGCSSTPVTPPPAP